MSLSNSLRLTYLIISAILIIILFALMVFMYKKKNEYRRSIGLTINIGIFSTIAYCIFLLAKSQTSAVLFDSIYFIGTDWLAMGMYLFAIDYTEITKKNRSLIVKICGGCCLLDTISLLINNKTHHMFNLVEMVSASGIHYWGNDFYALHYVHLGMCYVMVGLTFIYFAGSLIKAPVIYKVKYSSIFIAYLIVILANFSCYTLNTPFDISVILYGLIASFICYFSTFSYPKKLLEQSLLMVNETISDAVLYFDLDNNCIYANKLAQKIFSDKNGFSNHMAEEYRESLSINLEGEEEEFSKVNDTFVVDGYDRHYEVEYQKKYLNKKLIGSYMKLSDKTEEYEVFRREKYSATHDELTDILNRNGFCEAVDSSIAHEGVENKILLVSDIKGFKFINESFGEEIGDEILKKQAKLFNTYAHTDDIYARIIDDKFAIYMSKDYYSEELFLDCIKKMQRLADNTIYQMHIHVGVYEPHSKNETAQIMLDKAFMAIQRLSNDYNTVFSYYDSALMEIELRNKNICDNFETALKSGQIKMYLQPIVNLLDKESGAEALCRWDDPLRGLLIPEDFLPVLEKNGLVYLLDEFIWEEAFKMLQMWGHNGHEKRYISVNVSVKDFYYTDIYKTFVALAEKYDVNPQQMHIEITETVLMADFEKAQEVSSKLQKYGFKIAIDNFGNGYSSLNMLKDFKADILKIDMIFLQHTTKHYRNSIILEAMISLAQTLDMEVVACGIENQEQYLAVEDYCCENIQGNYIAHPKSAEEWGLE